MTHLELQGLLDSYRGGHCFRLSDPAGWLRPDILFHFQALVLSKSHTGGSLQNLGLRRRLILKRGWPCGT